MEPLVWLGKVTDCDVRHVSVNGVANKAGIPQTTLARRLKDGAITADMAIKICRAYKYPVVRGLRELGFITDKDLKAPRLVVTLQDASDRELAEALIDACREDMRAAVVLASWGCLRYSEIPLLERKDINVRDRTVRVRRAIKWTRQGAYVPGPPKSEAGRRTVTIPSSQWHHIQTHLDRFTGAGKDAPLFYRADNPSRVLTNKVFATAIKKACEKAGIPVVSPHELRHTGLTLFGQTGATLADLKYRAGHSTVETVMIYQHSNQRRDSELADKM